MFLKSAELYDLFYEFKNYSAEVQRLQELIRANWQAQRPARTLLDIACGTGHHIQYLKRLYETEGLDLNNELLNVARERNPDVAFHTADMTAFDMGKQYDVIVCLFSAIGYVRTVDNLNRAIACMARHVQPGGLLMIEPWFSKEEYHAGTPHAIFIDQPGIKAARMNLSRLENRLSLLDFHYLVATEQGVEYFVEHHELGLFSRDEHISAFRNCGLDVSYDPHGLMGRGLYIGVQKS